jgi:hypothetical protein
VLKYVYVDDIDVLEHLFSLSHSVSLSSSTTKNTHLYATRVVLNYMNTGRDF